MVTKMVKDETTREQLSQALELVRRAAANEKENLKDLVESKFSDLRGVFADGHVKIADRVREQGERLAAVKDEGVERAKRMANRVDHYVHSEPWWIIGVSTAAALLAGYLLGRDRR